MVPPAQKCGSPEEAGLRLDASSCDFLLPGGSRLNLHTQQKAGTLPVNTR